MDGKNQYESAANSYIMAMALANRMLEMKLITKKEFVSFEEEMRQKYGLSKRSFYRDNHLQTVRKL